MSILKTFYILYKSDTSDLKKGSEDALKSTSKLNDSLNSLDKSSEKIGRNFGSLISSLVSAVAAFASVHAVIEGFSNAINYDIDLGKNSRALGVNASELDAWGNALKINGGTAEDFQTSLRGLAEHFHTTPAVALKALPQFAEAFSKLNRYAAFSFGKSIGLNEPTILLLQQGRREVESILEQQRKLGVVTQKQIEVSKIYNESLINLEHSYRTLSNSIAEEVAPYFSKFFDILSKGFQYLTKHKDFVIGAFGGIASAAISAALAFGVLTLPIVLTSAAVLSLIGLFALLYDDLQVYSRGGESLIGKFLNLDLIKSFSNVMKDIFGFGKNADFNVNMNYGKQALDFASSIPLNSMSSNSILNSSAFNRNTNINTGPLTIHTQATDAIGISKDIGLHYTDQLSHAVNYYSDNKHA